MRTAVIILVVFFDQIAAGFIGTETLNIRNILSSIGAVQQELED